MREIRLSGLEGGGAGNRSPYPYPFSRAKDSGRYRGGMEGAPPVGKRVWGLRQFRNLC